MATYWESSAHSAYDIFSRYKCLIVNLVVCVFFFFLFFFFLVSFLERESLSDCAFS